MVVSPKVAVATLAAAVVTIVVWVLSATVHVELPPEVQGALTTVLVAVAGYLTPQ